MRPPERLVVLRGDVRCGEILARNEGTIFRYDDDFPETDLPGGGIATTLPREASSVATPGRFLPTFFENLLPEGFRASAIRSNRRLAADDAYGLLSFVGRDTVGDIRITTDHDPSPLRRIGRARRTDRDDFDALLARDLTSSTSVAGVQPKISDQRVTLVREGRDILKLTPPEYPGLVENEALVMEIAGKNCRLPTAHVRIIYDRRGTSALSVQRFDRGPDGRLLHQEDGCQLLDRYSGAKYDVSLRSLIERARSVSSAPLIVSLRWLELWAFSYLIGNGDLHLKNLSLHQPRPEAGLIPTPAYDLVSTLVYPALDPKMALQMDGKDDALKMKSFVSFFTRYGLDESQVTRTVERIAGGIDRRLEDLRGVAPSAGAGERAIAILRRRADRL